MTERLTFTWEEGVCCDLCNPAKLAEFEHNGVIVRGPTWRREVCVACIMTLEDFFRGQPVVEKPLEQDVCDVFRELGGARLDLPQCACGAQLPSRADIALQMEAMLAELGASTASAPFTVAVRALVVRHWMTHCERCAVDVVAKAVEAMAANALGEHKPRRPYTKPTITVLGPLVGLELFRKGKGDAS